jgi:hypothetical protein
MYWEASAIWSTPAELVVVVVVVVIVVVVVVVGKEGKRRSFLKAY